MPKTRSAHAPHRGLLGLVPGTGHAGHRRTLTTLGDLLSAVYLVAGSPQGAARLLGAASPLGQLLDRRIVIG
jgi:hypothetical protein